MGKDYAKGSPVVDSSAKSTAGAKGTTDPTVQLQQQAGNQAVQGLLKDTPTFDDYDYRTQGRVPSTISAGTSPARMAGNDHVPVSRSQAVANFVQRFPFLKELPETYKDPIGQILGHDQQNYRDFLRDNTVGNNYSISPSAQPYSLPPGASRLRALNALEFASENAKRAESITADLVFSGTSSQPPASPLSESDEHTYLRETWEKITKQPVYLTIDAWSERPLQLYITDGTFSWEVHSSPRPIEMTDLLSIQIIRREYVRQQTVGPKRMALEGAIREATAGLVAAQEKDEDQTQVDKEARFGVVGFSKWRGKRAAFPDVVEQYESVVYGEMAEKKREAYEPSYLEQIGFVVAAFSDALDALQPKDALSAQYLRSLTSDQKAAQFWKNIQLYYNIADDQRRWSLKFTKDEMEAIKTEATKRAEQDWDAAPDILPEESSFNRAAEVIAMATKYLDAGDLEAASIYASLAIQMEQQIATSVDRYKIRVTTGAGRMVETLEHVKLASRLLLSVLAPMGAAQLGFTGFRLLAIGAAVPAAVNAASSIAAGEGVGVSLFEAQKEFITGLLIGKLTELMSISFVAKFGLPRPAADILANVTASPYGAAGDILFRKMMNPDAPLPTLEELQAEMTKNVAIGSLITIATHAAVTIHASATAPAEPPSSTLPRGGGTSVYANKMSGVAHGIGESTPEEPSVVKDKYARFNEEWTGELRMQGPGILNVLPSRSGPELTFGTFKRNIRTPTEAYEAFNEAVARSKDREVGIIRNIHTGEYMVRVGHPGSVGPPVGEQGTFETVLHTHPDQKNILTYRLPSGTDIALAQQVSGHLGGRPVTQFIEYPLPTGGRGRTAYTVEASGKVRVDFVRSRTGKAETIEFSSPQEFQEYWNSRTRAVEKGSEDYNDLMNEAEAILTRRRRDSGDNTMSSQYRDPSLDPDPDEDTGVGRDDEGSVGYDSKLGVRKKTVTPEDLVRAQKVRKMEQGLKIEKVGSFPPEVEELVWELNDANLGRPDPLALYLARSRGSERDLNFRDFVMPKLKEMMPPNTVFGARDHAALRELFGVDQLPWEHKVKGGGPDLFLVNGNDIQPLDLTTQGESEGSHMERLEDQVAALRRQLPKKWTVLDPKHFYHGPGRSKDIDLILQLVPYIKRFGGKVSPQIKSSK